MMPHTTFTRWMIAIAALLAGCSTEKDSFLGPSDSTYFANMGTVVRRNGQQISEQLLIRRDDGLLLAVVENLVGGKALVDGQRILANYDILGDLTGFPATEGGYNIRLNSVRTIPTQGSHPRSSLTAEQLAAGLEPFDLQRAWFGAHYLNIVCMTAESGQVWLIRDDEQSAPGELNLELRHTAGSGNIEEQYHSFNLASLPFAAGSTLQVTLRWRDKGGNEVTTKGAYTVPEKK